MKQRPAATSASGTGSKFDKSVRNSYIAEPLIVIPPDGGWGWVVVVCSFYSNFVCDGISFTFGIFLQEISEDFNEPCSRVSLANSISSGICYLAAPIVCALINRYGFIKTGFLGGLLSTVSVILSRCRFINFPAFLVVYGGLSGFGICMLYCSSIVIISFYFKKWRALSVSIAVCGSSTGIIVFPVIFRNLCGHMHWRTKFLILGGFCALASLVCLSYKPVKPRRLIARSRGTKADPDTGTIGTLDEHGEGVFKGLYTKFHNLFYPTPVDLKARGVNFELPEQVDDESSLEDEYMFLPATDNKSSITTSYFSVAKRARDRHNTLDTIYEESSVVQNKYMERCDKCCACYLPCCVPRITATPSRPMYRDDVFYHGSVATIKSHDTVSIIYLFLLSKMKIDTYSLYLNAKSSLVTPSISRKSFARSLSTKSILKNVEDIVDPLFVIPPDGGWGWLVVIAACLSNLVVDGATFSFGIFIAEISRDLGVSVTNVALANSFSTGSYMLLAPVVCAIMNRLGFRLTAFIGGLFSTTTILISSYVPNLWLFLIFYGVLTGFAFSMVYIPTVVIIGSYFERWRAIASSMGSSGSAMGIIAFPPIFTDLLGFLHWRTKFKILACSCMSCALLSFFYKPLKPVRYNTERTVQFADDPEQMSVESVSTGSAVTINEEGYQKMRNKYLNNLYPTVIMAPSGTSSIVKGSVSGKSILKSATSKSVMEKLSILMEEDVEKGKKVKESKCCRCKFERGLGNINAWCFLHCACCYPNIYNIESSRPMYRDDALFNGSIYTLPEYQATVAKASTKKAAIDYHISVTRVTTQLDLDQDYYVCICCPMAMKRTLATMLDLSLLKSPSFFLILMSGFFTTLGMFTPFIYIAEFAVEKKLDYEIAMYLISAVGISNFVGRITCGLLSSIPHVSALFVSTVCLLICGGATCLNIMLYTRNFQFTYAAVYGLTIASLPSLRSIILVDLLGLEKLTNSFGLVMSFQGIACLIGVPISGALKDYTSSYREPFIFAGLAIFVSGILLIPIKSCANWEKRKEERKQRVNK